MDGVVVGLMASPVDPDEKDRTMLHVLINCRVGKAIPLRGCSFIGKTSH